MPLIKVVSGEGRTFDFPITKDKTTIGRSKENDIMLPDYTVSRLHAEILKVGKGYLLTDLGSYNGTKVNEKPIQKSLLRDEDSIRIGKMRLTFFSSNRGDPSLSESIILTPVSENEKDDQKIVKSSPQGRYTNSRELLVSMERAKLSEEEQQLTPKEEKKEQGQVQIDLSSLERSNKVLFVLYEISRQLNTIQDFNELLRKIMDLIFMVVDADYGFLLLMGDEGHEDLLPVVVKYKHGKAEGKEQLRVSRTIIDKVIHDKVALLTSNAMADSRLEHARSLMIQQIRSAMCVPLWKKDRIIGVIQLDSIRFDNQFTNEDLELLKAIGSQMAMIIEQASLNEQIREEERMRSRLERFHSPQVIDMILKGGQETKDDIMEPKDITATILFTDIVGFTTLSELKPPREITMLLNQFFARMTDIVFKYDGTLDKYIGDALMAVFGAPMEKEDDAVRAIRAAQEMRSELAMMEDDFEGGRGLDIRIGINTGRVVAGNIGSPKRIDYTVIGDPVNIASRLESIATPNQILIGDETYWAVKEKFNIRKVGPKKVKGKRAEIMVYEVLD